MSGTPMVFLMALQGMTTLEIKQLKRDLIKHKLSSNLKLSVKDVSSGSELLFGAAISNKTSQISATNSTLTKGDRGNYCQL